MNDFPLHLRHPSGALMELERDRVLVAIPRGAVAVDDRGAALDRLGLVPEPDRPGMAGGPADFVERLVNNTDDHVFARTADGGAFRAAAFSREDDQAAGVAWVAPVYRVQIASRTELVSPMPHTLIVRVIDQKHSEEVFEQLRAAGLEEDEGRSRYLRPYHYFRLADPMRMPAYELRDELVNRFGDALDVRLEHVPAYVPTAMVPNDPMFVDQWNLQRIRAGGPGQTAWNLQQGAPDVVICILDQGCQLNHPDLVDRFIHEGINLGTMSGTGAPTGNHGTPCAGIAAASTGNAVGVAGVAGGCRILPVAFATWSDVEVAAGLRYAIAEGASVISMSFGWNAWDHAIIDPAIQEAFDANLVMCVATQNQDTANGITYPATNPLVMACGASDQTDNRKSLASPDGELWGSNFGRQMSVVAPGVLCKSTDRLGGAGYTAEDYVPNFNGTSAATPHVAGLAALLRSADRSLSNMDVRAIIEQAAAKVGTVPYTTTPGHPNGTWNNQMGYGRIDAMAAVQQVSKSFSSRRQEVAYR